ncbi:MAG: Uma2 family endonuclease [Leptolyngbyaceae cyanobacterium RU_5_1]|nr:Uma2 family endonuclease [Leptolyngbyaceae cyanobacterium RU_5_1]
MVTTPSLVVEDEQDYDASGLPPDRYDEVPEGMEEVDGELIEKTGMTIAHAATQGKLIYAWTNHVISTGQGGEVYAEAPCRTDRQKRRPDVAYMSAELLAQYGRPAILPHSYPLIGEVASADDKAEALFDKAREYLRSGCLEVWLLFPENQLVMIVTQNQWQVFTEADTVSTQTVLQGFQMAVAELFA